ncbi:MAG: acyl-CoA thioesterase [Marmoricola sp.]
MRGVRHTFHCPMRWADLDMLGHVNNVTYLNYLREARVDFFAALGRTIDVDDLDEAVRITRNQVMFVAPLLFRQRPITIELWTSDIAADSFTLNYEIFDETPEGRRVYLRVRAELHPWVVADDAPRSLTAEERAQLARYEGEAIEFSPVVTVEDAARLPASYDLTVRLSDLDIYRRVSDVIYFEYFQEARVAYLYDLAARAEGSSPLVIARTDVTYHQPIRLRREPYLVRSGVAGLGNSSLTIVGQILDGDRPMATAQVVLVGFDPQRQAAAPLASAQRAVLAAEFAALGPV